MKKNRAIVLFLITALFLTSCVIREDEATQEHRLFTYITLYYFDTAIQIRLFARNRDEFDSYTQAIVSQIRHLHMLFDTFNEYEGINNIATINRMAGIAPVAVEKEILELLSWGIEAYHNSGGGVNIAMGPVFDLWRSFLKNTDGGGPPSHDVLSAAASAANFDDILLDFAAQEVFLRRPGMSLDVGALAKAPALEAADAIAREMGVVSGFIYIGGDIKFIGAPLDGRDAWLAGINHPQGWPDGVSGAVFAKDTTVVSSGDSQRRRLYDGNVYHHIIDMSTLMPARFYSHLVIVHPDARVAQFLSTAAFVLPSDDALFLVESFEAQALWITVDGDFFTTNGFDLQ